MLCVAGRSILQYGVLAEVGHPEHAMELALDVPDHVFESAGGNGHSLSNTLWYVSSRPDTTAIPLSREKVFDCGCPDTCTKEVQETLTDALGYTCKSRMKWLIDSMGTAEEDACAQIAGEEFPEECGGCNPSLCSSSLPSPSSSTNTSALTTSGSDVSSSLSTENEEAVPVCGCKNTCNDAILNLDADGYSCGARIKWLMGAMDMNETEACAQVGGIEFADICGGCDPDRCENVANLPTIDSTLKEDVHEDDGACSSCSSDICESSLNRCPIYTAPYLCYLGPNRGKIFSIPFFVNYPIIVRYSMKLMHLLFRLNALRWLLSNSMEVG